MQLKKYFGYKKQAKKMPPIAKTRGTIGTPKIIGGRVKPLKSGFFCMLKTNL